MNQSSIGGAGLMAWAIVWGMCGHGFGQEPAQARARSAAGMAAGRWIDLTHAFDDRTIYWPTEKGFVFEAGRNGPTPKGYYYAANRFASAEHGGTHLDAPRHFSAAGQSADRPCSRLRRISFSVSTQPGLIWFTRTPSSRMRVSPRFRVSVMSAPFEML